MCYAKAELKNIKERQKKKEREKATCEQCQVSKERWVVQSSTSSLLSFFLAVQSQNLRKHG